IFNDCGKSSTVPALICTVFEPALVSRTVWFVPGRTPRDQVASCQFPPATLIQLLSCARLRPRKPLTTRKITAPHTGNNFISEKREERVKKSQSPGPDMF